ncbi:hypothetical protein MPLB_640001 [Mesorhizobium sp. ORS 3324]|nr:hypothetical protein MPLB_640001 [Mesorhizobium sp. ORS 3324]
MDQPQSLAQSFEVSAAPHPPAGTFSPYRDGEKGLAAASALFMQRRRLAKPLMRASLSPSLYGERMPAGR